jgi:hypothetical protein
VSVSVSMSECISSKGKREGETDGVSEAEVCGVWGAVIVIGSAVGSAAI